MDESDRIRDLLKGEGEGERETDKSPPRRQFPNVRDELLASREVTSVDPWAAEREFVRAGLEGTSPEDHRGEGKIPNADGTD